MTKLLRDQPQSRRPAGRHDLPGAEHRLEPVRQRCHRALLGQKLFTGCYGLNRFGMMETDPLIVQAQMKLLKRADDLIVMADSRKLRQRSSMIVAGLDRISTLITDSGARDEELEMLRAAGIKVIVVEPGVEETATE